MSAEGQFRFQMEDLPEQTLALSHAGIVLYAEAMTGRDVFSVHVDIHAEPRMVAWPDPDYPEDPDIEHRIAPSFYTEWFDMPRKDLKGRGAGALDGVGFDFADTIGDFTQQPPGAIYQDSHAPFTRATMQVDHLTDALYGVRAQGQTEFGWTFALEATAPLTGIIFRHADRDAARAPDAAVEAEFETYFDRSPFDCAWTRRGPEANPWFDFVATPKGAKA